MRAPLLVSIALIALAAACSSSDDPPASTSSSSSSSSSTGGAGDGPPDPSTLFDTLPAGSPDKLRGVWETKESGADGDITLRFRFTDDYLAAAAQCKGPNGTTIIAPNLVGLDSADIDKKEGGFAFEGVTLSATEGENKCNLDFPGGNFTFVITGTSLSLAHEGEDGTIDFTKVGD